MQPAAAGCRVERDNRRLPSVVMCIGNEIRFIPDLGDYRAYSWHCLAHLRRSLLVRRLVIFAAVAAALPAVSVWVAGRASSIPATYARMWWAVPLAFIAWVLAMAYAFERGARNLYGLNAGKAVTVQLEGDAFLRDVEGQASRFAWSSVSGVVLTPRVLLLLTGESKRLVQAVVVPRSAFATPAQADAFRRSPSPLAGRAPRSSLKPFLVTWTRSPGAPASLVRDAGRSRSRALWRRTSARCKAFGAARRKHCAPVKGHASRCACSETLHRLPSASVAASLLRGTRGLGVRALPRRGR